VIRFASASCFQSVMIWPSVSKDGRNLLPKGDSRLESIPFDMAAVKRPLFIGRREYFSFNIKCRSH
jgi:hypothetical protein